LSWVTGFELMLVVLDLWSRDHDQSATKVHKRVWSLKMNWLYGSWIYNYLCNQCLSPLMLWVRISIRVRCTTLCDKVCQWLAMGRWFSSGSLFSPTNKTDCNNITKILLNVAFNTIKQTTTINFIVLTKTSAITFSNYF
jgi:hypothetical protein